MPERGGEARLQADQNGFIPDQRCRVNGAFLAGKSEFCLMPVADPLSSFAGANKCPSDLRLRETCAL